MSMPVELPVVAHVLCTLTIHVSCMFSLGVLMRGGSPVASGSVCGCSSCGLAMAYVEQSVLYTSGTGCHHRALYDPSFLCLQCSQSSSFVIMLLQKL